MALLFFAMEKRLGLKLKQEFSISYPTLKPFIHPAKEPP